MKRIVFGVLVLSVFGMLMAAEPGEQKIPLRMSSTLNSLGGFQQVTIYDDRTPAALVVAADTETVVTVDSAMKEIVFAKKDGSRKVLVSRYAEKEQKPPWRVVQARIVSDVADTDIVQRVVDELAPQKKKQ